MNYLVWILVVLLYAPVFNNLYNIRWDTVDYTHAYFILPISLWLAWRSRQKLKEAIKQDISNLCSLLSFFVLVLGGLMFFVGWRQDYVVIQTFSLIPVLFGLVGYLYGTSLIKILSFPILYLLLLVPPPFGILDSITMPMRYGIAAATELVLNFTGFPITRSGLEMTIGYNTIFMGEPCSGFRSLITMISLVMVYVYVSSGNLTKKIVLTSFIIPMALLGNLARVITLCLITFYFGEETGQGFFHNFSGIVIFIITISGIMGVESILDRLQSRKKLKE